MSYCSADRCTREWTEAHIALQKRENSIGKEHVRKLQFEEKMSLKERRQSCNQLSASLTSLFLIGVLLCTTSCYNKEKRNQFSFQSSLQLSLKWLPLRYFPNDTKINSRQHKT